MKIKYEALLVLNTRGNEDGANKIIDRLELDFKKEGAEIEQVQRLDRRHFSYVAGPLDSGYFVNFVFVAEPHLIGKIRSKFKLDADIYRAHYQKIPVNSKPAPKPPHPAQAALPMANLNKVMLMGNLTRDPEVRYTPKGTAVAELGLAINRVYSAENGEKREETTFVDITLWGRTAEIAGEYLKKGRPVFIEGRLQLDTWDDKQTGQKRSKLKVVGEAMQLIGSRGGEGGGGEGGGGGREYSAGSTSKPQQASPPKQKPPANPDLEPEEDDIPF